MESRIPWVPILVLGVSVVLVVILIVSIFADPLATTLQDDEAPIVAASITALREELTTLQNQLRPAIEARDDFIGISIDDMMERLSSVESHWDGGFSYGNVIRKSFAITDLENETETPLFVIETADEDSDEDGGYYGAQMNVLVGQGVVGSSRASASRVFVEVFTRNMISAGNGSNSEVAEVGSTTSAANIAELRDIGNITMRAVEKSEYQTEVSITAELLGTNPLGGVAVVSVELVYFGFETPPRILEVTPDN